MLNMQIHPCNMLTVLSRYERSRQPVQFGRSLVQRHVALPEDLANEAGEGLLVSPSMLLLLLLVVAAFANSTLQDLRHCVLCVHKSHLMPVSTVDHTTGE